jgi:hypothetical protein
MSDQIDPAFKAAYRETQGQPVDAVGRDTQVIAKPSIHLAKLMSFEKDGHQGIFDIIDGKFDYTGDLPVSDAARLLFETLADYMSEWWFERAATKTALAEKDARIAEATRYAERLASILWQKHYKDQAPGWKPLSGDLVGILTQIDNMTSGLASRAECERLRAALEPFGRFFDLVEAAAVRRLNDDETVATCGRYGTESYHAITYGHFRQVRAAYSQKETGDE